VVDTLELLLHPVRLRITWCLSGGRTRSTSELCAGLPDVPKATVYRYVALLAEGGLLGVAEEQCVRGAVERRYRLRRDRAVIDAGAAASMSLDDHRHGFAAVLAVLLARGRRGGHHLGSGPPGRHPEDRRPARGAAPARRAAA
jgi:hypothetical protein